ANYILMKARLILSLSALILAPCSTYAAIDYQSQVRPILRSNCYKCHGGPRAKKDFRMDKEDTLKEHIGPGKYIVPGKPDESLVIKLISLPESDSDRMPPPNRGAHLERADITTLKQWILEGALLEPGDTPPVPVVAEAPPTDEPMVDKEALHTWKSKTGKEIKAYFVRVEGSNLVLRSEAGAEKPFPGTLFAQESIDLAKKLATQ
ncbi:MAG: c-type cytochrome domain-containing protein, partial [Verrucomicrobiota bacterium]